tara:strand:- start:240 stop:1346 length:1107 start_codon:yes stop_codon:yes gene_type:complete
MKVAKLIIKTIDQKYPIFIGSNLISKLSKILNNNSIKFEKCLLVIDRNVPYTMIKKIRNSIKNKKVFTYTLKANEKNKNLNTTNNILKVLLEKNFSRQDCLFAIGGGITGDISGFAASQFKRGLQFINIPTTLLAQVDSSIGGKTGVNTKFGKNLVGTFYQPKLVIADINFLNSLHVREIICGYGEILKHSLISDKRFFKFLKKELSNILNLRSPFIEKSIIESCKIKKKVVEKDEKEKNLRKILNFGHTFAHAFEASLNYSKKLNHGEAVILGIFTALKFSYYNKFLGRDEYFSIKEHIESSNLPYNIKKYFSLKHLNRILTFMIKDKKNNSEKINLVLLKKIGNPMINKTYKKSVLKLFLKKELTN